MVSSQWTVGPFLLPAWDVVAAAGVMMLVGLLAGTLVRRRLFVRARWGSLRDARDAYHRAEFAVAGETYTAVLAAVWRRRPSDASQRLLVAAGVGRAKSEVRAGNWDTAEAGLRAVLARYDPSREPFRDGAAYLEMELAAVAVLRGEPAEAIRTLQRTLADIIGRRGTDDMWAVANRVALAEALLSAGSALESAALLSWVLRRRDEGVVVPLVDEVAVRDTLARALLELGRLDEAEGECEWVLASDGAGVDHRLCRLFARGTVAKLRIADGQAEQALHEQEALVAELELLLRPEHPWLLDARFDLAVTHRLLDDRERSLALHRDVAEARARVLGPDHPDTVRSHAALAEGDASPA